MKTFGVPLQTMEVVPDEHHASLRIDEERVVRRKTSRLGRGGVGSRGVLGVELATDPHRVLTEAHRKVLLTEFQSAFVHSRAERALF